MATLAQNLVSGASNTYQQNGGIVPDYGAGSYTGVLGLGMNPYQTDGFVQGLGENPYPTGDTNTAPAKTAEQIATERKLAEDEATRQSLKGNIGGIIQGMTGIYDQLYSAINSGVGEAGTRLQDRYTKETGALGDTFNQELPKIGMGYAARGLYDSSYRLDGENQATKGFQDQITGLGDQLKLDKETIGGEALKQQSKYQLEQSGVNGILARLNEVTDLGELQQLRNELDAKQRTLESEKSTFATADARRGAFEKVVNTSTDRSAGLISTLQNIIKGSAPRQLKVQTAQAIIVNSDLPDEEKRKLTEQVVAAV